LVTLGKGLNLDHGRVQLI